MKFKLQFSYGFLHRFVIYIVLVGSVFIDLLNGYLNYYKSFSFPIGVLFRVVVTLYLIVYILLYRKSNILRFYLIITIVIWFMLQLVWLNFSGYSIGREVSQFIKIIYPQLLAIYLLYAIDRKYVDVRTFLKWGTINVLVAGSFIIFSFLTGIGLSTYGNGETTYGFGTTSFFKAQNDISLTMLMGFSFCIYFLFTGKKLVGFTKALIVLLGLILIGTRAGMIGGFLIAILFVTHMLVFGQARSSFAILKKFGTFIGVIIGLILVSYFVYLKIKDKPYMVNRYIEVITNPPRAKLEEAADEYIDHRSDLAYVLGPGVGEYRTKLYGNLESKKESMDADEGKDAEKDITDMLGAYGLVLGFWILAFPIICCFMVVRNFVLRPYNYLNFAMALCILIFEGHSIIAGHGIKNPAVGTLLALVYVFVFTNLPSSVRIRKNKFRNRNLMLSINH